MAAPMGDDEFALNQTIYFVNTEFRDGIDSLRKVKELRDQVKSTKLSLEKQLTFATTEAPGKIETAVHDAEKMKEKINKFSEQKELLCGDVANHMADTTTLVKHLSTLTDQINELERYSRYLQCVGQIEDYSSDIQSALLINSTERSVAKFAEMAEFVKSIQASSCCNLVKFGCDTVLFWYKILKDKYSSEFDEVLKAHGWPFIISTVKTSPIQNITEVKAKLEPLFCQLLHLQLPEGLSSEGQPSHPFMANLPDWRPLLLPMHLMMLPLKKRFKYHFFGNKQTNSIDKPEWFFTQILSWIRDHRTFLHDNIQPLLEKSGLGYIDAVVEFTRGLVMLVMEKLLRDIPDSLYDEQTFSHLVDETLAFDRELREAYNYPTSQCGCLHVLSQDEPFNKWLIIEKKFAMEKMDAMLSSETAWQSQYRDIAEVDDMKVPECGESFMTLMQTITERYKALPSTSHQLRFLDLQLDLLDDYRIRLLQVKTEETGQPLSHCFTAILNTVSFIAQALRDWSELVFFLQLQYYRAQEMQAQAREQASHLLQEGAGDGQHLQVPGANVVCRSLSRQLSPAVESTASSEFDIGKLDQLEGLVFDDIAALFDHMRNDMLNNITRYVLDDVKARSRPYRREKWLHLPSQKDANLALSSSACEMFLVLKDRLHEVQQALSKPLFNEFWVKVAEALNKYFYEEVVLSNFFNDGGAQQLNFDMTRNLFPLFGQYTRKPENYFKNLKESCILLTLNVGSALLLKDVLYQALHEPDSDRGSKPQDPIATLHETGIFKLGPEDTELILSLRTNLTTT